MNHWPRASLFTKSSYFIDALFTMALIGAVIPIFQMEDLG